jgi:hypothetical protein
MTPTEQFVLLAAGPIIALLFGLSLYFMARMPPSKRGRPPAE